MDAVIAPSYLRLNSLFFGKEAISSAFLKAGETTRVKVRGLPDVLLSGKVYPTGLISGMAFLYRRFTLALDDRLHFDKIGDDIELVGITRASGQREDFVQANPPADASQKTEDAILKKKCAEHLAFEILRTQSYNLWEPQSETDVYVAFGLLEDFVPYYYCCATTSSILRRLGINDDASKPDAILVEEDTGRYLVAEFKMRSSAFKLNHKREDIDVLVTWIDDEADRSVLPREVIVLKEIAQEATREALGK